MSEAVTSADFQSKVLESDVPVLVDFFATWCGPCRMLAPVLEEVATEVAGKAKVVKLDIDQSPDIAQRYGVMSVPTLIVFENGQVKRQTVGAQPKQNVLALLAYRAERPIDFPEVAGRVLCGLLLYAVPFVAARRAPVPFSGSGGRNVKEANHERHRRRFRCLERIRSCGHRRGPGGA